MSKGPDNLEQRYRRKQLHTRFTWWVGTITGLAGCAAMTVDQPANRLHPPSDFALVLHIQGHDLAADPAHYTSQYIIEPNRKLRTALGQGTTAKYFPDLTRQLSPIEFDVLSELVLQNHLMAEPTSPGVEEQAVPPQAASTIYTVSITSNGRTNRYATTPHESPATFSLVKTLIRYRTPILPVPMQNANLRVVP